MPMRAWYRSPQGDVHSHLNEEEVKQAFLAREGLLWVDISDTTVEDGQFLARVFDFHPLTIEDCVSPEIRAPKIDDLEAYLFAVVNTADYDTSSGATHTHELDIYLGGHFVVSNHIGSIPSVEDLAHRAENQSRVLQRGADFLAYYLIDGVVDQATNTLRQLGAAAERVEEEVLQHPSTSQLQAIAQLKHAVVQIDRVLGPQLEVLNRLSRGEFEVISDKARLYYRDVYDHLFRITGHIQALHERSDSTLSVYLLSLSVLQNEIIKVLSIVASIFLPITFVASIYGMNFRHMPELLWGWGYYGALGLMAAIVVGLMAWFRYRRWI